MDKVVLKVAMGAVAGCVQEEILAAQQKAVHRIIETARGDQVSLGGHSVPLQPHSRGSHPENGNAR